MISTSYTLNNGSINSKLDSKNKVWIQKLILENVTQGLRNLLVKTISKKDSKSVHNLYFSLELEFLKKGHHSPIKISYFDVKTHK